MAKTDRKYKKNMINFQKILLFSIFLNTNILHINVGVFEAEELKNEP